MGKYAFTDIISGLMGTDISERNQNALLRCPFHEDRLPSLSIDLEQGVFLCFGCDVRGNIYRLAQLLNQSIDSVDVSRRLVPASTFEEPVDFAVKAREQRAALYRDQPQLVVSYITERNLLPAVVREFGLGWDEEYRRIAMPYYDEDVVTGIKYRSANGKKSSEENSKRTLYNLNNIRLKPVVFLCEGESDTHAVWSRLQQIGAPQATLDRIGVGGMWGSQATRTTWDLWSLELWWAKEVYIMFDDDESGDKGAQSATDVLGDKAIRIRPTQGKDMTEHFLNGGKLLEFQALGGAFSQPIAIT